jgi:hypothetical protein
MAHRKRLRALAAAALVAVAGAAGPARAADAPATRPATDKAPAAERKLIKVTGVHADTKEPITVVIDVNDAPEHEAWAKEAATYAIKWYPTIERTLATDGFTPPREFRLVFKRMKGVAYTTGNVITVSAEYVSGHQDDRGMVAHELTHVIQRYRRGEGWLTEGIADYVRYYVVEPGTPRARFDPDRQQYKGGYQPAAGMLNWLETTKGPGVIAKLNAAQRAGKYTPEVFKEVAGGTPDEVWDVYRATLKTKAIKPGAIKPTTTPAPATRPAAEVAKPPAPTDASWRGGGV